jgi:hypothetical protein
MVWARAPCCGSSPGCSTRPPGPSRSTLAQEEYSSQAIAALIVLTPLGIAFWKTFKNLDLKPMRLQLKPYLVIALPSIVAVLALAVFYFTYYLNWLYNTM